MAAKKNKTTKKDSNKKSKTTKKAPSSWKGHNDYASTHTNIKRTVKRTVQNSGTKKLKKQKKMSERQRRAGWVTPKKPQIMRSK